MRVDLVVLIIALVVSRLRCLSLDQIHSSSQTFKSLSHNKDKIPKTGIESIRNRRGEYRYEQWNSIPMNDLEFYQRVMSSKKPTYEPVDDILMVSETNAIIIIDGKPIKWYTHQTLAYKLVKC